ncbi:MAG: hypothetical protein WC968_03615 [Bacilli bacterium]
MLHDTFHQIVAPLFLLGDFGSLLSGFDFIGTIFGILNQIPFLVDAFIAAALVGAILRGIFKKFWKVVWRGIIFVGLVITLILMAGTVAPYIGQLPIPLKGFADGNEMNYANLAQTINGVMLQSGYDADYALAFTDVVLKNLVIFFGVPLLAMLTPLVSALTYPIFSLLLSKKLKKLKLIPAKLAISVGLTIIAVMVFAIPMATLVPPLTAVKATLAEGTLLYKFLHPEVIGFLELFTVEKSIFLKIVNLGNVAANLNFFSAFTYNGASLKLSDELPLILQAINNVVYTTA